MMVHLIRFVSEGRFEAAGVMDIFAALPNPKFTGIFADIVVGAVSQEREDPSFKSIYPKDFILRTVLAYCTKIIENRDDWLCMYKSSGLCAADAVLPDAIPLTKERYEFLKIENAKRAINLDEALEILRGKERFDSTLPPYLNISRAKFTLGGQEFSFTDCGEIALLNFFLSFIWHEGALHPEFLAPLKAQFPKLVPIIEFLETHSAIEAIEQNRGEWAKLVADNQATVETPLNKVKDARSGKVELVGGMHSLSNLLSILFEADEVMDRPIGDLSADKDLVEAKWRKVFELLNRGDLDIALESIKVAASSEIKFVVNNEKVTYDIEPQHFYLSVTRSSSKPTLNLDDDLAKIIQGYSLPILMPQLIHMYFDSSETIFSRHDEFLRRIPKPTLDAIFYRTLMTAIHNRLDDGDVVKKTIKHLMTYCGNPTLDILVGQVAAVPTGRAFLLDCFIPYALTSNNILRTNLLILTKGTYFNDRKNHPHLHSMEAFYGRNESFKVMDRRYKQGILESRFRCFFEGPLTQNHPLYSAAESANLELVRVLTDEGKATYWKFDPNNPNFAMATKTTVHPKK